MSLSVFFMDIFIIEFLPFFKIYRNNGWCQASIVSPSKLLVTSPSSSLIRNSTVLNTKEMQPLFCPGYKFYSLSTTSADTTTATATASDDNLSRLQKSSEKGLLRRLLMKIGVVPNAKHVSNLILIVQFNSK